MSFPFRNKAVSRSGGFWPDFGTPLTIQSIFPFSNGNPLATRISFIPVVAPFGRISTECEVPCFGSAAGCWDPTTEDGSPAGNRSPEGAGPGEKEQRRASENHGRTDIPPAA